MAIINPMVSAQPLTTSSAAEADTPTITETDNASSETSGRLSGDRVGEETSDNAGNSTEDTNSDDPDSWVDDAYNATNSAMHNFVFNADNYFGEEQKEDLPTLKRSRFHFGIETLTEDKDGLKFNVDLDLRLDIRLPRIQERFGLFISTSAPDELPGENPDEVENPLLIGLEFISAFNRIPYLRGGLGTGHANYLTL